MNNLKKYTDSAAIKALIDRIGALRQSIIEANDELASDIQSQLDNITNIVNSIQADNDKLNQEIIEINRNLDIIQDEIFGEDGSSILDSISEQLTQLEQQLANKADLNHTHTTSDITDLQSIIDGLNQKYDTLNSTVQTLQEENATLKQRIQYLENALATEITPEDIDNSMAEN